MSESKYLGEVQRDGSAYYLVKGGERLSLMGIGAGAPFAFRQAFGRPQPGDVGKRVYSRPGGWQMENDEQRRHRLEATPAGELR